MTKRFALLCVTAVTLAACSQKEPPAPIYGQPVFDKQGNASCEAGYTLVTTETGAEACAPLS
ncbi:hypothetical protein [Shimia biformata]|uniref:hypothetical protein n=1 Tax=Shimia biformata TaxID=1294299 RepID=UPI00194F27FC|nr:hypothetical protein [Shimia biformata]